MKAFKILDLEKKKRIVVEVNEIIDYMNSIYDNELDEFEPEVSLMKIIKEYSIFNTIEGGQGKLKIITPFI
ncbi:MAG: hypothetical protein WCL70_01850 [Paludibacter sp.]